ncbi:MAG: hypothetical protein M5U28_28005 [Sandaracinaceae bacterium]|nr:hypothetical protein [Sandaracinaceae bacterium]
MDDHRLPTTEEGLALRLGQRRGSRPRRSPSRRARGLHPGASYGHEVLIIAAARFHRLIPCVENGSQVYYVRLGASTVRADDWLLRDLFLTRRARPHIIPTTRATNYDEEGDTVTSATRSRP